MKKSFIALLLALSVIAGCCGSHDCPSYANWAEKNSCPAA